ncbi:MAG: hypothetical protein LBT39_04405 [Treponema sp.]|jgi:hypothetical protein|nr:hypothetical protein [Treponema sp.]
MSNIRKDIIVTIICLAGAAFSFRSFWNDLNRTMENQNALPVGYIEYKIQAVQRRFGDRVLWQRLSRGTPVYGEDLIRTAEHSEATIYLDGGPGIGLAENTLIQIRTEDGKTILDLGEGGISVDIPETMTGTSTVMLVAGNKQVDLSAGASISAAAGTNGDLKLQVSGGSVTVSGPDGVRQMDTGEIYSNDPPGTPLAAALNPRPNARLFTPYDEPLGVSFSWTTQSYPAEGLTRLEVAEDRRFSRIVTSQDLSGTAWEIDLRNGVYWWRVFPASGGEDGSKANGDKLTITKVSTPLVVSPSDGSVYRYRENPPAILFQWSMPNTGPGNGPGEEPDFILTAADNPAMNNPQVFKKIQGTEANIASFVYTGLGPGQWYWRVQPLYAGFGGTVASAGGALAIEHEPNLPPPPPRVALSSLPPPPPEVAIVPEPPAPAPPPRPAPRPVPPPPVVPPSPRPSPPPPVAPRLPPPVNRLPAANQVIRGPDLRKDRSLNFQWSPVSEADGYIFTLYVEGSRPGQRRQIIRTTPLKTTTYTMGQLSLLDRGIFFWQVEAVQIADNGTVTNIGIPGENRLVIDVPVPTIPEARDPGVLYGISGETHGE